MISTHRARILLVVAALTAAGCGGGATTGTGGSTTETGGSTGTSDAAAGCRAYDDVAAALAGSSVGEGEETTVAGLDACRYPDGRGYVQISHVSAAGWAAQLPEAIRQVEASGLISDADGQRKLDEAKAIIASGGTSDAEACRAFGLMASLQNREASDRVVNVVPSRTDPRAITGQTCTDGVFSSVLVVGDPTVDVATLTPKVETALDEVHRLPLG